MSLAAVPGSPIVLLGPGALTTHGVPTLSSITMDAANEAAILIGYAVTSDGGSHTLDTTGSSSIGWRTGGTTFANAGTTFKVGVAAVDTANGPPARAVNVADVITFDVSASFTGGGGGVTTNAWQTSVPTAGTKTIANGDLIAICWQMTARGNVDSVPVAIGTGVVARTRPAVTGFTGGSYTAPTAGLPNALITFSDGATCHLQGTDLFNTINTRTWNGSGGQEYGQLFNFPFPYKVYGIYGWLDPDADCDVVLYSAPLSGSPVAEKTISIDANAVSGATGRRFEVAFPAPYTVPANTDIAAVLKPGGSNVSAYYRTLANAGHRVTDVGGTSSYGIQRTSGAFANANSSLDHYYIGLIAGAFEHGVWPMGYLGA